MNSYPKSVRIVEVGPRDGLQNETDFIATEDKIKLIELLVQSGLKTIEATSFVNPKRIPQTRDATQVLTALKGYNNIHFPVLTPNLKGLEVAIKAGAKEIAVFASASEAFSQKNINCSIDESFLRFKTLIARANEFNLPVRGYVSCVLGCPYEGQVATKKVENVAKRLLQLGCYEISLGDTIGVGTPADTARLLEQLLKNIETNQLAVHFHDTYGQALANILIALEYGISTIDSAIGGLGGCPYAEGASGNVATEDVIYMLNGMNITTEVDINKLLLANKFIYNIISKNTTSKVANALLIKSKA